MAIPFRADHVGSFLPPPELTQASRAFRSSEISADELRQATDQAIIRILNVQRDVGLEIYSDGEYRRDAWQTGPLHAFAGFVDAGEVNLAAPQNQNRWRGEFSDVVPMAGSAAATAAGRRRLPVIGGKLSARSRLNGEEVAFLKPKAPGAFKITDPSPTWFLRHWAPGVSDKVYATREDALADLVAIMKDEIAFLVANGVPYIQIDSIRYVFDFTDEERRREWRQWGVDPDAAIEQNVMADSELIAGLKRGGVTSALHMCRGNFASRWYAEGGYDRIAARIFPKLAFDRFLLEYDTTRPVASSRFGSCRRTKWWRSDWSPRKRRSSKKPTTSGGASTRPANTFH